MATRLRANAPASISPDRKKQPDVHAIANLALPEPALIVLDNDLKVNILHYPDQKILKIEVVYLSGRPYEQKRVASRATARLQREGTRTRTGAEIAEHFDFFGASFGSPGSLDTASFSLFSLHKHAAELIPVLAEVLHEPIFPEHELAVFQQTNIQELMVELEKAEVVAYRKITELIFGTDHPYGYNSVPEGYAALTTADLKQHFEAWHTPANCMVFAAGCVDDEVRQLLNQYFGQQPLQPNPVLDFHWKKPEITPRSLPAAKRKIAIPQPGSLQSAIKIGRPLFTRHHPDFNGIMILNTILGGYFGSRLMTNIREKKGYTYNIYSSVDAMMHDGYFYIATEVSPDKKDATLRAIWSEVKKLRDQPVPEEELEMVKSYLLGLMLTSLDGAMNTADVVRAVLVDGVGTAGFLQQVERIRSITPAEIQALAQEYLQQEDFWTVVVG